ncbi:MAG: twin-arginine translocation signal domain-containing protein, partial [Verrucomicrobia bacterium]|nr:twin-arginine translocation signal domain-containing protein [Verrucomicrobiota bacterium]
MNRRTFLKTSAGAGALWLATPTAPSAEASSVPGDSELLARAKEQIEKHRKGDGAVLVRDA